LQEAAEGKAELAPHPDPAKVPTAADPTAAFIPSSSPTPSAVPEQQTPSTDDLIASFSEPTSPTRVSSVSKFRANIKAGTSTAVIDDAPSPVGKPNGLPATRTPSDKPATRKPASYSTPTVPTKHAPVPTSTQPVRWLAPDRRLFCYHVFVKRSLLVIDAVERGRV
jgi:hypothetical protein